MEASAGEDIRAVAESITAWALGAVAGCRRPYGIDHFDFKLTFGDGADSRARRLAFDRLRPIDLYQEAFAERLADSIGREIEAAKGSVISVSASLFSWGEAAHLALPNRIKG